LSTLRPSNQPTITGVEKKKKNGDPCIGLEQYAVTSGAKLAQSEAQTEMNPLNN
jgi:hypothetical protein